MTRCGKAGCCREGLLLPKLHLPARGLSLDQHRPATVILEGPLCALHAADLTAAAVLTSELREALEEPLAACMPAPADFERAWLTTIRLDSREYAEFEARGSTRQ